MVGYVPPLSPVMNLVEGHGSSAAADDVFPAIDALRIPVQYLANLLSAGDETVIRRVLQQLAAMRRYMREQQLTGRADATICGEVAISVEAMDEIIGCLPSPATRTGLSSLSRTRNRPASLPDSKGHAV